MKEVLLWRALCLLYLTHCLKSLPPLAQKSSFNKQGNHVCEEHKKTLVQVQIVPALHLSFYISPVYKSVHKSMYKSIHTSIAHVPVHTGYIQLFIAHITGDTEIFTQL